MIDPLVPRITKSTALAVMKAMFDDDEALLKRFVVAKDAASLWDGERDGLREAVKVLEAGQYGRAILSWKESAPVTYVNADGKYQLERTLQTTVVRPDLEAGSPIIAFHYGGPPEHFLDRLLSEVAKGKDHALAFVTEAFVGVGKVVDNEALYSSKASEQALVTILPEVTQP